MSYFTKYLPVEGDITSKFMFSPQGNLIGFDSNEDIQKEAKNKGYKPAKLFLCSRDIVYGEPTEQGTYIDIKILSHNPITVEVTKVLGEVSPDALSYVKEGQEFEESDVRIIYDYTSSSRPWKKEGWVFDGYSLDNEGGVYSYQKLKNIEIKGPCNHFH